MPCANLAIPTLGCKERATKVNHGHLTTPGPAGLSTLHARQRHKVIPRIAKHNIPALQVGVRQPKAVDETEALQDLLRYAPDRCDQEAMGAVLVHEVMQAYTQTLKYQAEVVLRMQEGVVQPHTTALPRWVTSCDLLKHLSFRLCIFTVALHTLDHLYSHCLSAHCVDATQNTAKRALAQLPPNYVSPARTQQLPRNHCEVWNFLMANVDVVLCYGPTTAN
mmetsp:Transcript_78370/g.155245  ORF Transcript_78370/g.155245 Transcript_78370/m.155245 type:complete len:221 (+) Transcript_78370:481-1143(+)